MNMQRQNNELRVTQDLEKLISQVPLLSDQKLEKMRKDIAFILSREGLSREGTRPCRNGDQCKLPTCCFTHPCDEKKASAEELVSQLREEAAALRHPKSKFSTAVNGSGLDSTKSSSSSIATPDIACTQQHERDEKKINERKNHEDSDSDADADEDKDEHYTEELCRQIRCALNKLTWSNYNTITSQVASLVDALFVEDLLIPPTCDVLLAMVTDYTIYVEAYGKMWSALAEVYPCLLAAEKKLFDGYLAYYAHCVDDKPETPADQEGALSAKKKQRTALTSFLVHTMKYSSVSVEREEVTEKMQFLVTRLDNILLVGKNSSNCGEFNALLSDLVVFVREGWEVLHREEVWPLCIQQIEKIIGHLQMQRRAEQEGTTSRGTTSPPAAAREKCSMRSLFVLEEVLGDIKDQGAYHTHH
jgi:hypothetical protein